jgi:hypothetical protein
MVGELQPKECQYRAKVCQRNLAYSLTVLTFTIVPGKMEVSVFIDTFCYEPS